MPFQRLAEFQDGNSRFALAHSRSDAGQALTLRQGHASGGLGLHVLHICQTPGNILGEQPVPSVKVPLVSPLQKRSRRFKIIDRECLVVKPMGMVASFEAFSIRHDTFDGRKVPVGQTELRFQNT
ncbi:hypothetical protein DSECCO2_640600 [anaerobic digester metagenome]